MLKITLSPKITPNMLDDLQITIKKHHELLIKEFSVPLTPKDHYALSCYNRKNGPSKSLLDYAI